MMKPSNITFKLGSWTLFCNDAVGRNGVSDRFTVVLEWVSDPIHPELATSDRRFFDTREEALAYIDNILEEERGGQGERIS